jgi:hypothetical protein
VEEGLAKKTDVVYLSGNTPLVVVLREALARDQHVRKTKAGEPSKISEARTSTRATIQHINDFLKEYIGASSLPPAEHVIVFDEAQRAWDARQGKEKFGRDASEPLLLLEAMARHKDWSVTVCLIGLGQEINDGEEGVSGWADAIDQVSQSSSSKWKVYGPQNIFGVERSVGTLGPSATQVAQHQEAHLHLDVPMRSFRSPQLGQWIAAVLAGDASTAKALAQEMSYPVKVTRSLQTAKAWLKESATGERRMGLLASSGARRLRADGIGEVLSATDGSAIAHWYLNPPGDIRASTALEVPANEYTSQGLELDFACLCWGGDLIVGANKWSARRLAGNRWTKVGDGRPTSFVLNSYRVLMSRAREGMVIWIPLGNEEDHTRDCAELTTTYQYIVNAGAEPLS